MNIVRIESIAPCFVFPVGAVAVAAAGHNKTRRIMDDAEIHVLSIEGQEHRLDTTRRRLAEAGVGNRVLHVDGVIGKHLTWRERFQRLTPTCALFCTGSCSGTSLSHVKAWEMIANGENETAVVLEDDVIFRSDTNPREAWQYLKDVVSRASGDFDVFLLGHYGDADPKESDTSFSSVLMLAAQRVASVSVKDSSLCGGSVFRPKRFHGIHAYVVTREGAKKLLRHCSPVSGTPDITISNANADGSVRVLACRPSLLRQDESGSSQTSKHLNVLDAIFRDSWFPAHKPRDDQRPDAYLWKFAAFQILGFPVALWTMVMGIGAFLAGGFSRSCSLALLVGTLAVAGLLVIDGIVFGDGVRAWELLFYATVFGGFAASSGCLLTNLVLRINGGPHREAKTG